MVRRLDLLAHIIDPRYDDIRAYPLLTTFEPVIYGRPLLASGLHLAWREEFFDNQKIQAARHRASYTRPDTGAQHAS